MKSFGRQNHDLFFGLKKQFLKYLEDITKVKEQIIASPTNLRHIVVGDGGVPVPFTCKPVIENVTPDGYPILPEIDFGPSTTKKYLASITRSYLLKNYGMSHASKAG